jgi:hypothetical protein
MPAACYELAHEAIHLLTPDNSAKTTVLEEGLATHFATAYVRTEFKHNILATIPSYAAAAVLVQQLLNADQQSIKKLRNTDTAISAITVPQIMTTYPDFNPRVAEKLCSAFER